MSEVTVIGWFDQDSKTLWEFKPKSIAPNAVSVVLKSDYDAAQPELAALREELANAKEWSDRLDKRCVALATDKDTLIDRCKAAEQRNSDLCQLIRELTANGLTLNAVYRKRVDAALQPTESGASE